MAAGENSPVDSAAEQVQRIGIWPGSRTETEPWTCVHGRECVERACWSVMRARTHARTHVRTHAHTHTHTHTDAAHPLHLNYMLADCFTCLCE